MAMRIKITLLITTIISALMVMVTPLVQAHFLPMQRNMD